MSPDPDDKVTSKLDYTFTLDSLIHVLEDIAAWKLLDLGHGERVAATAVAIAKKLGKVPDENSLQLLNYAGRIHDLGRIAVDDSIMNKPGPLTISERGAVETHPVIGYRFLVRSNLPPEIVQTILHHHEHWDGSGYPDRLAKSDIPFFARIVTIADMWDALKNNRPYRKAMGYEDALKEMHANKAWFDPYLFGLFLEVLEDGKKDINKQKD